MPNIKTSTYRAPFLYRHHHIGTIMPNLLRKVEGITYQRKRIETPDEDFLDLDFSRVGSKTILLLMHGLEGSSDRQYAKGMIKAANKADWDGVVLNMRGCSGEANRLYSSYHSGKTDDLDLVVQHLIQVEEYTDILIFGVSLGGNITLKYVGEQGENIPKEVRAAAALSVPCHLQTSAVQLQKPINQVLYVRRFIKSLVPKGIEKVKRFARTEISIEAMQNARNFYDIDNLYTAPAHGFKDAEDYWEQCHSRQFLSGIRIPTLLINAQNDPFLSPECYPYEEAENNPYFYFEAPKYGGHVGFSTNWRMTGEFWQETRVVEFFNRVK